MNVVHIVTLFHPHPGGIATMVRSLSSRLVMAGDRCGILTRRTGHLAPRATVDGVEVQRVGGERGGRQLERLRFLRDGYLALRAQAGPIDVLHAHSLYTPALLATLRPEPAVATVHTVGPTGNLADLTRGWVGRRRIDWYRKRLRCIIALTEGMAEEIAAVGFERDRIEIIPNGVDPVRFFVPDEARRRSVRRARGVPEDARVVAFLGRLAPEKGVDVLLDAWPAVAARISRAVLVVAGSMEPGHDGDGYPWGKAGPPIGLGGADATGSTVQWWRDPEDSRELYHAADVVVLPSRTEAFGLVAVEAMACGVPVVASRVGGLPEVVGEAATLVPPGDSEALARGIVDILEDHPRRLDLAAAGRCRVLEHFSLDRVVARHRELYARIVGSS